MFDDFFSNPLTILNPSLSFTSSTFSGLSNQLFGSGTDYNAILEEQRKIAEEEKKRKALEANRIDLKGSQMASLAFSQPDMTNDFLGL